MLPSCPATLSIRNISVTSKYRYHLQQAHNKPAFIQKLKDKNNWQDHIIDNIEWRCLTIAINRIQRPVLTTKCCNNLLPTALSLYKRKYQDNNKYVLCGAHETGEYLIHCNHHSRIQCRRRFIRTIRIRLTAMNIDDAFAEVIANCITD